MHGYRPTEVLLRFRLPGIAGIIRSRSPLRWATLWSVPLIAKQIVLETTQQFRCTFPTTERSKIGGFSSFPTSGVDGFQNGYFSQECGCIPDTLRKTASKSDGWFANVSRKTKRVEVFFRPTVKSQLTSLASLRK